MKFGFKRCMIGLIKVSSFISVLQKFNAYFLSVKNHTYLLLVNTFILCSQELKTSQCLSPGI